MGSPRQGQLERVAVVPHQGLAKRSVSRVEQPRVGGHGPSRRLVRTLQHALVAQVREPQAGQAALTHPPQLAWTAHREIGFREREAIIGGGQLIEPMAGIPETSGRGTHTG